METALLKHPRVGVGTLIFDQQMRVLLGQRLNAHGAHTWSPPGGHLEFGESFQECSIREVLEETGLVISKPKVIGVTNDIFHQDNKHYVSLFLAAAYDPTQTVQNREPHKIICWQWHDVDELPENLFLPLANFVQEVDIKAIAFTIIKTL